MDWARESKMAINLLKTVELVFIDLMFRVICYHLHFQILRGSVIRVRPIPCRRPIPDTIGRSCTDTNTDTGNDVPHSLGQTYITYVVHTARMFQNITLLTLCFETCETNYRLETTGKHATVLTVETRKQTTGIGADTKISIGRYRYPPIPDTGIGLTLSVMQNCSVSISDMILISPSTVILLLIHVIRHFICWDSLQSRDLVYMPWTVCFKHCSQQNFICLTSLVRLLDRRSQGHVKASA